MTHLVGPFNQLPSARYQIVEHPSALPGCCFICRSDATNREWFVDIGLQFDFHGAIYICSACIWEMAHTVGWLTPDEARSLQSMNDGLSLETRMLRDEVRSMHEMEEAIGLYVRARGGSLDPVLGSVGMAAQLSLLDTVDDLEEPPDGGEVVESAAGSTVGIGEGTSAEPSYDEGVDDLRADDGGAFSL